MASLAENNSPITFQIDVKTGDLKQKIQKLQLLVDNKVDVNRRKNSTAHSSSLQVNKSNSIEIFLSSLQDISQIINQINQKMDQSIEHSKNSINKDMKDIKYLKNISTSLNTKIKEIDQTQKQLQIKLSDKDKEIENIYKLPH